MHISTEEVEALAREGSPAFESPKLPRGRIDRTGLLALTSPTGAVAEFARYLGADWADPFRREIGSDLAEIVAGYLNATYSEGDADVQAHADRIIAMIRRDIDDLTVPADVPDFSTLHDYVDANYYVLAVIGIYRESIDDGTGLDAVDLANAVTDEVNRRLPLGLEHGLATGAGNDCVCGAVGDDRPALIAHLYAVGARGTGDMIP
jgi:hypothetical protein